MKTSTTKRSFIEAVLNIEDEKFRALLDDGIFDHGLLTDINISEGDPCPIYWITQCWEQILAVPEEWNEVDKGRISTLKEKNLNIRKIFEEHFKIEFKPIDFYNTSFWFYRIEKEESFFDFFGFSPDDTEQLLYPLIDYELYLSASKLDFITSERLLKEGANPETPVSIDSECILYSIASERNYLESILETFIIGNKLLSACSSNSIDIINVLGFGAYERMNKLLTRYIKKTNKR